MVARHCGCQRSTKARHTVDALNPVDFVNTCVSAAPVERHGASRLHSGDMTDTCQAKTCNVSDSWRRGPLRALPLDRMRGRADPGCVSGPAPVPKRRRSELAARLDLIISRRTQDSARRLRSVCSRTERSWGAVGRASAAAAPGPARPEGGHRNWPSCTACLGAPAAAGSRRRAPSGGGGDRRCQASTLDSPNGSCIEYRSHSGARRDSGWPRGEGRER